MKTVKFRLQTNDFRKKTNYDKREVGELHETRTLFGLLAVITFITACELLNFPQKATIGRAFQLGHAVKCRDSTLPGTDEWRQVVGSAEERGVEIVRIMKRRPREPNGRSLN